MIFFDNSATTEIYPESLKTFVDTTTKIFGNPSSLHRLGAQAHRLLEMARSQIADLFSVASDEIFFTSGGTESNNWVIKGTAIAKRQFGNHIIISEIEHPSVRKTAESLISLGFEVDYLPVDSNGIVKYELLSELIKPTTILVSIMAVNNEVGSIQPIKEISEILTGYPKIHFHLDAVQAISKLAVSDYLTARVDFLTASAHKFHGPRGVGFIINKSGRQIAPLLDGGGQERGKRATTENLAGIVAMAKALRISFERQEAVNSKIKCLKQSLIDALNDFSGVVILSPVNSNFVDAILTIAIPGVRGEVLVHALENYEIFVSTTSACSSKKEAVASTLSAMRIQPKVSQGAIRLSFGEQNTMAEVEQFMIAFKKAYQQFKKHM